MKRTGWNKGTDKPVHSKPGFEVYERDYSEHEDGSDVQCCVFRGGKWFICGLIDDECTIEEKIKLALYLADCQCESHTTSLPWRGLSSPPKGFKP